MYAKSKYVRIQIGQDKDLIWDAGWATCYWLLHGMNLRMHEHDSVSFPKKSECLLHFK